MYERAGDSAISLAISLVLVNLAVISRRETLLLATNRLQTLPITFGNLRKLDRVIADCNRLRRVPETLSRMTCHTLSFNCNQLVSLPRCLVNMANLSLLSANDNQLKALPMNIGSSKSLMSIKLCANQIGEIPEERGDDGRVRAAGVALVVRVVHDVGIEFESHKTLLQAGRARLGHLTRFTPVNCRARVRRPPAKCRSGTA